MSRRMEEPVTVRVGEGTRIAGAARDRLGGAEGGDAPSAFLWRGRLYVVREVLGHWRERCAWWTSAAARAVHGEGGFGESSQVHPSAGRELGREREVWRVEASVGRAGAPGVYDLCRVPDAADTWSLLRIAD